jgi:cytochrome c2
MMKRIWPTGARRPLRRSGIYALLLVVTLLAACGASGEGGATGDVAHGQRLFRGEEKLRTDGMEACTDCHSDVVGGESPIGQNLSNIGNRAATTVPGQTAISYLRTALLVPDAHLAGGFQEGIMPRNYAQLLNEQDINDLIAYMLSLKSGSDE